MQVFCPVCLRIVSAVFSGNLSGNDGEIVWCDIFLHVRCSFLCCYNHICYFLYPLFVRDGQNIDFLFFLLIQPQCAVFPLLCEYNKKKVEKAAIQIISVYYVYNISNLSQKCQAEFHAFMIHMPPFFITDYVNNRL